MPQVRALFLLLEPTDSTDSIACKFDTITHPSDLPASHNRIAVSTACSVTHCTCFCHCARALAAICNCVSATTSQKCSQTAARGFDLPILIATCILQPFHRATIQLLSIGDYLEPSHGLPGPPQSPDALTPPHLFTPSAQHGTRTPSAQLTGRRSQLQLGI